MNNLLQIAKIFISKHIYATVFLVLAAVIFVSGYWHVRSLGIYSDDWGGSTYVFQPGFHGAISEWWKIGSGEVGNFRFLAVALPALWYGVFKVFGLTGIVLFNFLCYLVLAWLAFILLKQHVSQSAAFLGAMLFALYPTNNAYLWQVTLSYTLALIFILSAAYFFNKNKLIPAIIFLILGLLVNEGTFFIFAFALLPPAARSWKEIKPRLFRWIAPVAILVILYSMLRVSLELKGLTGSNRALYSLHTFNLISYLLQFFKAEAVVLVISWAVALWKICKFFNPLDLIAGLLAFFAVWSTSWFLAKGNSQSNQSSPWLVMLLGLILICAGRYYGFYYVPSINTLNLDTRYYFAASVGGAVFFSGLFEYLLLRFSSWKQIFYILAAVAIGGLATFRFSVQRDYRDAWANGQKIWQQLLFIIPKVPAHGLLYVDIPHKILGKPVVEFEAVGDLRVILPFMGKTDIVGVTSPYITNMQLTKDRVCITAPPAPPFYDHTCFNKSLSAGFVWKNGRLQPLFGSLGSTETEFSPPKNFKTIIGQPLP